MDRKPIKLNGKEVPQIILDKIYEGSALTHKSEHYPSRYNGEVPLIVQMNCTVGSFWGKENWSCEYGQAYCVSGNKDGVVSAIFEDGNELVLESNEFTVVQYHNQLVQ